MAHGDLRNLDLNLALTLDALLRERNVTRAAGALGLSQPSVSTGLARLRRHFNDELLHRSGNRYQLTALAEQLAPRVALALTSMQRVFDSAPDFDPASDDREFTIVVSDYAATVLGDHLATALAQEAPGSRLRLQEQTAYSVDHALELLRTVDGMVLPHGFVDDIPALDLHEDTWVCVVSADNTEVGDALTMEQLAHLPWVVTYNAPTAYTPAVRQLRMIGVEPKVQVVVESFVAVPFLVAGTNRVALLQGRLAERLAGAAGVRTLPCPWEVVPLMEAFWWHPTLQADPAHRWLRDVIQRAGEAVTRERALERTPTAPLS